MKRHAIRYGEEQILEALKELAMNGGNLRRTSLELGVSTSSLVRWRDHFPAYYATARAEASKWINRLLEAEYDDFLFEKRRQDAALAAMRWKHH